MKLNKALRGYYREQVDAVTVAGENPVKKTVYGGRRSWVLNAAFHAALIGFIVSAMLLGRYQPSRLEQCMGIVVERYNVEYRMMNSFDGLIILIKKNRNLGGEL